MRKQREIVMTKKALRKLIAKEIEAGAKITVLAPSTKKVDTFRHSSSIFNRGRKKATLSGTV